MTRIYDFRFCLSCKRGTPHTKRGCAVCRKNLTSAIRKAKKVTLGSPLATHGQMMKLADELWSVWVRASVGGCAMCGAPLPPEKLQWAHHWSRSMKRIRYHLDNASVLCFDCHRRHTPPGPDWFEWVERRIGSERYEMLKVYSKIGPKLTTEVALAVMLDALRRIATLPAGPRAEWAALRGASINEKYVRLGVSA